MDISLSDLQSAKPQVTALASPKNTIMDFNITSILMFASHGRGVCVPSHGASTADITAAKEAKREHESVPYTSQARVLLVGVGADEQLGKTVKYYPH